MNSYVVVTLLLPESAIKVGEVLMKEGWTVRRAGPRLVESSDAHIGGITVFEVGTEELDQRRLIRERVIELLDTAKVLYFSIFVGAVGGSSWSSSNVPFSNPTKELPTAWQRLDNPEL